jgi:transposase
MMGRRQRIEGKLFYSNLSLEDRVRPDNPLRQVKAAIDFGFVRAAVKRLYGVRGNPSVDPAVLMKLMLLLVLENIPSERQLMQRMSERVDWMWFCGYDWDDEIPNHSVISKARRRWGVDVFVALFQQVLSRCVEAGLLDGHTLHVDASIVKANADKSTLHPALGLVARGLYDRLDEKAAVQEAASVRAPAAGGSGPEQVADSASPVIGESQAAGVMKAATEPVPGTLISSTDPDARLTRKYGQTVLGYKDHRVVDDRCGIITATVTTDAARADSHVINEVLDQHEQNVASTPATVVADRGYGTAKVYQSMADRKITPCIPHQKHTGIHAGIYEAKDFTYDAARDAYRCVQGQWLDRYCTTANGSGRYQAAKGVCAACPKRSQCTTGRHGRRLTRHAGQDWIDWADNCYSRGHRRRLLRRRMHLAEGSFADATNHHGYKRARWRGLAGMTIQNLLVAAAQNLRKLIGAGRRRPAQSLRSAVGPHGGPDFGQRERHFSLFTGRRPIVSQIREFLTLFLRSMPPRSKPLMPPTKI